LPPVPVVPQDIARAFLNVLGNAFRAVTSRAAEADGSFRPRVTVTTALAPEAAIVRIRDNGSGIPHDLRERIFAPFFTTRPTREGTELGLSITHEIVVGQHGGKLLVDSEPGRYAEFIIELPLHP